jgi:hypothetical protein
LTRTLEQSAATRAVHRALNSGKIKRPDTCERCKSVKHSIVAHHWHGYDEPYWLDVQWLCRACHVVLHCNPSIKETYTLDERREFRTRGLRARSPEKISADAQQGGHAVIAAGGGFGLGWAKLTPEQRSERAHAARMAQTPEERSETARKGYETRRQRMAQGVIYQKSGPKPKTEEVMPA